MPKQKPFDYQADIGGGKKHRKVGKSKPRKMYFQAPKRSKRKKSHKR